MSSSFSNLHSPSINLATRDKSLPASRADLSAARSDISERTASIINDTRKPISYSRDDGSFALRVDVRQRDAGRFQFPPRTTRCELAEDWAFGLIATLPRNSLY